MIRPAKGLLKLINKKELSEKVTGVTFEVVEPKDFLFNPGQFITLMFAHTVSRAYSICSDVSNLPNLSLAVETGHNGAGSNYIKNMIIGDEVVFVGPSGRVGLPEVLPNHLYYFATGTGIAPFIPIFYQLSKIGFQGKVSLFFGVRNEKHLLFSEELASFQKKMRGFTYQIYFSKPENPHNYTGRITSAIPALKDNTAAYFICGHPSMVNEVTNGLLANGVNEDKIIKEEFTRPKQTDKV